jgi:hypothetical protein
VALGLAEEWQARERQLRRRRGTGQERRVVIEKARRGRRVEKVDRVVERKEELRLPFSQGSVKVVVAGAPSRPKTLTPQPPLPPALTPARERGSLPNLY